MTNAHIDSRISSRTAIDLHRTLLWAGRYVERTLEQAFAPLQLSTAKFYILYTLKKCPDYAATPTQIGRLIERTERVNLTAVLDKLESDGYVRRERHPTDRRALMIHLTEAGLSILEQASAIYLPTVEAIFAPIQESDAPRLRTMLNEISNH